MNENDILKVKPTETRLYVNVNGERKVALEGRITSVADLVLGVKISYKPNSLCARPINYNVHIKHCFFFNSKGV